MKDLKEVYNKSVEIKQWKFRARWNFIPSSSIIKYLNENGYDFIKGLSNVSSLFNSVDKESKKYAEWCIKSCISSGDHIVFTPEEKNALPNFFKGFIGEYFFIESFLNKFHGSLIIKNRNYSDYFARTYDYCAPLHEFKDFGLDGTCVSDDGKNCVVQVKFWNDKGDDILKISVMQKAYAEGVCHKYIDPYEKDNVIICWLGKENKVSSMLKANEDLDEHIVFVDKTVLDKSLDGKVSFWDDALPKSFENLCKL